MAFDAIIVKKISDELQNIVNYKIDKIYEPDKNTIILGLYGNFENMALLICISSNNYRMHLTTHTIQNPDVAPNFCMLLRKHILGYKIKKIHCAFPERVVVFDLVNDENPSKTLSKSLVVELMGKHSNFILLDCNGIIIDSLRHTSIEENSQRDIYPTCRYIMPISNNFDYTNCSNYKYFNETSLIAKTLVDSNDFELCSLESFDNKSTNKFSLNFSLDDFYFEKESSELYKNYRNSTFNIILSTLKRYEKRLKNIDAKLSECNDMEKYKLYGELITSNLYKIPPYNVNSISVENYYDNNSLIDIPLDIRYSPQYNAKRYYKKYSKLKNALDVVRKQKEDTINEINYIESIVYELENAITFDDITQIYLELSENNIFKISSKNNFSQRKAKKMTSNKFTSFNPLKYMIDGYTIYVGRNNKENDYLTNKFANKNDIWFHTKDIHGSHVILKNTENTLIPDNIIFEAAKLAALHSKAKNSSNVPVDYCQVKYVKKVPGNKPRTCYLSQ